MNKNRLLKYLKIADAASQVSDVEKYQLGAVIAKGSDILAVSQNQKKSHPLQKKYNKFRGCDSEWTYLHAEISAISKVKDKKQLYGATIFVSRRTKNNNFATARPCAACMEAIKDFGIKKIVYSTEYGVAEEHIF